MIIERYEQVGNEFGYKVYLPNNYNTQIKYPMILSLHGAGERGNGKDELDVIENIGLSKYASKGMMEIDAIIVAPQCPKNRVWNHLVFDLKTFIDKMLNTYSVNEDMVSVTGMSMGGFGTWEMILNFPSTFSAAAPICGGGMAWRTDLLKDEKVPIWAFHGDVDATVNISNSIEMVNGVRRYYPVDFTVFNNVNHNSWDPAYLQTTVINWLISKNRKNR